MCGEGAVVKASWETIVRNQVGKHIEFGGVSVLVLAVLDIADDGWATLEGRLSKTKKLIRFKMQLDTKGDA